MAQQQINSSAAAAQAQLVSNGYVVVDAALDAVFDQVPDYVEISPPGVPNEQLYFSNGHQGEPGYRFGFILKRYMVWVVDGKQFKRFGRFWRRAGEAWHVTGSTEPWDKLKRILT